MLKERIEIHGRDSRPSSISMSDIYLSAIGLSMYRPHTEFKNAYKIGEDDDEMARLMEDLLNRLLNYASSGRRCRKLK